MSVFLYLLLAHLVADFVLQPYELVRLKTRPIGLLIHVAIHSVLTAVLVAPFMPGWPWIVPMLGAVHYVIDYAKVSSRATDGPASFVVFVADQLAHLAVLAVIAALAGIPLRTTVSLGPPALSAALYYAVPYVSVTFAGAVVLYQLAHAYRTRPAPEELLMPGPRVAGYVERGLLLTGFLFLTPVFWWIGAVWYALRFGLSRGKGRWVETAASLLLTAGLALLFRLGSTT
ncbi:MAG: DUF3307 domain-containing protein [Armatimonadota bacterium]|nr:DUF3307 domain-containing protein [Armatimonadota bacterium]